MAYSPYYTDGWKNNEEGETPITAAALQNMEDGIVELDNAVGTLNSEIQIRGVGWSYTVSANGNANTSLKDLIDNDLPSGYRYVGLAGYSTNDVNVVFTSLRYVESAYGIQVRNLASSSKSANAQIYYMCSK